MNQWNQNHRDGYNGNPNLSRQFEKHHFTQFQLEELIKCSDPITGPEYFMRKYIRIVHVDHGLIPFDVRDYQSEIINKMIHNRFLICKMARQSGKSTTITAYFLWYVIFNPFVRVAILANKAETSRKLLYNLQLAYEWVPKWLQQGIVEWNKGSCTFANGSQIIAGATAKDSLRGGSYNIILLDEFAHVDTNMAEEFFRSVYPVISSGTTTKVFIVSTPKGMNKFHEMWIAAEKKQSEFITTEVHWSQVPGRDEEWKNKEILNTSQEFFDQEYECLFLGSAHTLISSSKLRLLIPRVKAPIRNDEGNFLAVFDEPIKGHTYVITVDPSRGVGKDSQAFQVIDVTEVPYIQVARYKCNTMDPLLFPNVIYRAAKLYNDAFVLVEINDIGQQIADIMHHEINYEHLIKIQTRGKQGQMVSPGYKKQVQFGVKTTTPVKKIGCSNLKALVESDKFVIQDHKTIEELSTFVQTKESYAGEPGKHDDLAMSLVIFGWLANQRIFKEQVGSDIRKALAAENDRIEEEELTPFGVVDNGLNNFGEPNPEGWVPVHRPWDTWTGGWPNPY
jgi:hypothetical protein